MLVILKLLFQILNFNITEVSCQWFTSMLNTRQSIASRLLDLTKTKQNPKSNR